MAEINVQVTGLDETVANLGALPDKLVRRVLRDAIQAGVSVIGKEVQARTPVETGLMAASVGTAVRISRDTGSGIGQVGFGKQGHVARLVEFGHRMIGHKPGKKPTKLSHVPAHPFMRPALDASADPAIEAFVEVLQNEVIKLGA